jgi:hypothetical protein
MAKQIITVTSQALLNSGMGATAYNRIIRAAQGADFTDADAALQEYLAPGFTGELLVSQIAAVFGLESGLFALGASGHIAAPALARMFAVQCARRVQKKLVDPRAIRALAVAEGHAKGMLTDEELKAADADAFDAVTDYFTNRPAGVCSSALQAAAMACAVKPADECARAASVYAAMAVANVVEAEEDDCSRPQESDAGSAEADAQLELLLAMLDGESIPDGWYVGADDQCEYDAMILAAVCEDLNVLNMPVANEPAEPALYQFDQAGLRRFVRSILEIAEDERAQ